jgi:exosortase/archaeosortase family protein
MKGAVIFFPRFVFALFCLQSFVFVIQTLPITAEFIQSGIAQSVAWLYGFYDSKVMVQGNAIAHLGTYRYVVVDNSCTGLMLLASICAVIVASAKPLVVKLQMVFWAIVILQVENICRISHLFFEIKQPVNNFEFYHLYVWQWVNFITAIVVLFVLDRVFQQNPTKRNQLVHIKSLTYMFVFLGLFSSSVAYAWGGGGGGGGGSSSTVPALNMIMEIVFIVLVVFINRINKSLAWRRL